jgi:predicted permease
MRSIGYSIGQDVRYSLRGLARNPAFAITAVLILALGIGGNSAIFTIIRSVLLRPLDYRDPDRLAYFSIENPRQAQQNPSFSLTQFQETKAAAKSFESLGAYGRPESFASAGGGEPEELKGARVSANFLEVLGVAPLVGRSFLDGEDQRGGRRVAMISAGLWRRRFAGDPQIAGKGVTLESAAYTIIGVLPDGFEFPYAGVDIWTTRPSEWSMLPPRYWGVPTLSGFGRLKACASWEQAAAEMNLLQRQYDAAHPGGLNPKGGSAIMRVVPLKDRLVKDVRPMLWTLFGAVGFVLLIACANVASLLLARATARSREFAVRAALGAGRGRLIRQLLAESLLLAGAGGALGVLLATWILKAIAGANIPFAGGINALYIPGARDIHLDWMVLAFTLLLSISTGVLFGLFPSLRISRPDLSDVLRDRGASSARGLGLKMGMLTRGLLVSGQVALSMILLVGAALLIESFYRLHNVDPGFQSGNLLTAKVALPLARYESSQKKEAFWRELLSQLEGTPGVKKTALAMLLPTTAWIRTDISEVEGKAAPDPGDATSYAVVQSVTPGYFLTLGIPVKRGRDFNARDNTTAAAPVMIVNETLARRLWPDGEDPIGRHVKEAYDKALGWIEVIGVVPDIHEGGLASDPVAEFYLPVAQHPPQTAFVLMRTEGNAMGLARTVRERVLAVDQDQPISDVRTMDAVFEATLGQKRLTMTLLGSFAGIALMLALVGVYGVMEYSVSQSTQEIGVRRALGAQRADILTLILGQGLGLVLIGIAIGVGGALALTRVMRNLLFHVSASDPMTFVGAGLLFLGAALVAGYIPARKAAAVDPMEALRVG